MVLFMLMSHFDPIEESTELAAAMWLFPLQVLFGTQSSTRTKSVDLTEDFASQGTTVPLSFAAE